MGRGAQQGADRRIPVGEDLQPLVGRQADEGTDDSRRDPAGPWRLEATGGTGDRPKAARAASHREPEAGADRVGSTGSPSPKDPRGQTGVRVNSLYSAVTYHPCNSIRADGVAQ